MPAFAFTDRGGRAGRRGAPCRSSGQRGGRPAAGRPPDQSKTRPGRGAGARPETRRNMPRLIIPAMRRKDFLSKKRRKNCLSSQYPRIRLVCFPTRRPEDKDLKEKKDQKGEQDVGERDLGGHRASRPMRRMLTPPRSRPGRPGAAGCSFSLASEKLLSEQCSSWRLEKIPTILMGIFQ